MVALATPAGPVPGMSEAKPGLVDRAQQGDRQAFVDLFRTHGRLVYSLILRRTGSVAEAENLTRDIFIAAFSKIDSAVDHGGFAISLYYGLLKMAPMAELRRNLAADSEASAHPGPASQLRQILEP